MKKDILEQAYKNIMIEIEKSNLKQSYMLFAPKRILDKLVLINSTKQIIDQAIENKIIYD